MGLEESRKVDYVLDNYFIGEEKNMKKKILLIDDEEDCLRPLAFRLARRGFQVLLARDGEQGLREAKEMIPDLIILDLFLPKLSGEEACKALREDDNDALENIPILMLTAKDSQADRIIGKVIGATTYMTKPIEINLLLKEISRLLYEKKYGRKKPSVHGEN